MTKTTFSKEYKSVHAAQADIRAQAKRGYQVISMTEIQQRAGLTRILLLGLFAGVFKPKPHVLVVYALMQQGATPLVTQYTPIPLPANTPAVAPMATPATRPDLYTDNAATIEYLKGGWNKLVGLARGAQPEPETEAPTQGKEN